MFTRGMIQKLVTKCHVFVYRQQWLANISVSFTGRKEMSVKPSRGYGKYSIYSLNNFNYFSFNSHPNKMEVFAKT